MKIVVADVKGGKSYQREVPKDKEGALVGRKVREKVDGGIIGLAGYSLEITGGSDNAGFPMRPEITGNRRVKAFISGGTGVRGLPKGKRIVKLVSGNTTSAVTAQLNTKIVEYGPKPLAELGFVLTPKDKKAAEKKPAEKKK